MDCSFGFIGSINNTVKLSRSLDFATTADCLALKRLLKRFCMELLLTVRSIVGKIRKNKDCHGRAEAFFSV